MPCGVFIHAVYTMVVDVYTSVTTIGVLVCYIHTAWGFCVARSIVKGIPEPRKAGRVTGMDSHAFFYVWEVCS